MSTYWRFICLSHKPEILMDDSVNHGDQRLADLWAERALLVAEANHPDFMGWHAGDTDLDSARNFLVQHPDCRLVIADGYGHERLFPQRLVQS